ncbi:MAG: MBL fold metallo-hydrolase [Gallionellales bacterium 35-53-114]|jgi:glyoxylase-like metal-dependent hydrolase (beta-lactamase superfamily II)|nr:MAG: MBL fold metallo-hydrolase [Gallionellales bacterium 35-53-114]OYZ62691.1 MAG: MBL fold metallo-hydrolase [Gallionellales bacterium 24-53-125]OZB09766.1 MAG: MBL fold metallo-hydrolase [Gallionellales bacterium 39-52-133]HQS57671.1 MBL fold metallo-hydrolase [Gallionellaceae bacterium]HQS74125.1 MBL fold metallo-hydrolase [Gallionellaceae bacterium]
MFFKQLSAKDSSLSYFLGCGTLGKSIAVDVVAGDEAWFIEEAKKAGVTISHVIDTHVHADHYSGGRKLAQMAGAVYCLHESDAALVKFPFHPLHDGDIIEVGNVAVKVMHTPGHTMDSTCLAVSDNRRADQVWFVITGDTLFVGSVGRPDLAGREQEMAGKLFDSLHARLLSLPDETEIFPGHQAGSVCGAGISGKPSSTIGFEKRFNPALRLTDRNEFIKLVTGDIPPRPAEMDKMVAANIAA